MSDYEIISTLFTLIIYAFLFVYLMRGFIRGILAIPEAFKAFKVLREQTKSKT
jgi:uncharacterized protein HemY